MSIGVNLINAIAASGSVNYFVRCKRDWFLDNNEGGINERNLYDFVLSHVRRYNRVPSVDTIVENGFPIVPRRPLTESVDYYFEQITSRAVYNALNKHHHSFMTGMRHRDMDRCLSLLHQMIDDVHCANSNSNIVEVREQFDEVMQDHAESVLRDGIKGITLGWDYLDNLTQGAQPGDVIVIVARPGMGKSYLLLHAAMKAWESGRPILIGSMEMSNEQIAKRMLSIGTGIRPDRFTLGRLSTPGVEAAQDYIRSVEGMSKCHLIAGEFKKTVGDMESIIRELRPDIAYIDAAYLLQPDKTKYTSNRREAIADVIEGLKGVARNTNTPIVVTVQFNRSVKRGKKMNLDLDSIGETDTIGQIASVVLGVQEGRLGQEKTERQLTVIKNRDGEEGKFAVNFKFEPSMDFSFISSIIDDEEDIQEENFSFDSMV